MLATLDPATLERLWFPLGEQTKAQTRAPARARPGCRRPRRAESQEACFLGGDDYRDFLARSGLAAAARAAASTRRGGELGEHDGFWRFTPGQRRGLGIAAARAALRARDACPRRTPSRRARAPRSRARRVRVRGRLDAAAGPVEVKLRYRSPPLAARVEPTPSGFELALDGARLRRRPRPDRRRLRRRHRRRRRRDHARRG